MARIVPLEDYASMKLDECEWIIPGYLPKPGVLMILGEPRAGKSFLALQLALAIAQGKPLLPGTITKKNRVLYFYFDKTGPFAFQDRLKELTKSQVDLSGPVFVIHPGDKLPTANLLEPSHFNFFKQCIAQAQPDVVVFDVLREFHNADENESTQMKLVGDQLSLLCQGLAVVLVHHTKKLQGDHSGPPRNVDASRGSNYIAGKADGTWLLYDNQLFVESNFATSKRFKLSRYADGRWLIV